MSERPAFHIDITLLDREPAGLRTIEKSDWKGKGLAFPRTSLSEVRRREEFGLAGVYVLWRSTGAEKSRAYVGQTDDLAARFESHKNSEWWTHAVVFTSTEQNLNTAHFRYLEARLVELATKGAHCTLDNRQKPRGARLSSGDRNKAEQYCANMLLCLPLLGVTFFEKPQTADRRRALFLKSGGEVIATGYYIGEGKLQVEVGSKALKRASIPSNVAKRRERLMEQGILKDQGAAYELVRAHTFDSPSGASDLLLGPSNGWRVWKDDKGVSLDELEPRPKGKLA